MAVSGYGVSLPAIRLLGVAVAAARPGGVSAMAVAGSRIIGPNEAGRILQLLRAGADGPNSTGSLFPEGAPAGPNPEGTGSPSPEGPPEGIPDGGGGDTKPWRKGWRRRWRPGSSFRGLGILARLLVIWVEENADDDGSVVTTTRYLAEVMSVSRRGRKPTANSTIWRALQEAQEVGILKVEPATSQRTSQQYPATGCSRITRLNYREYQQAATDPATAPRNSTPQRSSRGVQKEGSKDPSTAPRRGRPRKPADPSFAALLDALRQVYVEAKGEALDIPTTHLGDLKAIRNALGDDLEIVRRWSLFIRDTYWPSKNINRFRAAFGKYATKKPPPGNAPPAVPGLENY